MKREKWLDFVKIIASFLVVVLHMVNYGLNEDNRNIGLIFYYLGVFAIPLFFMVNGYLQLRKDKISYKYSLKKIKKIILVVLIWNFIIDIFYFLFKHELKNFIKESFENLFIQKGFYNYFWFLGALIIIYLILPLISSIFNKSKKNAFIFTLVLILFSILIDIINMINNYLGNEVIMKAVYQPFRIWTWLMYFCIGGCISKININKNYKSKLIMITILLIVMTICFEYFFSYTLYGNMYAEYFYDNVLIIITSTLFFYCMKDVEFNKFKFISECSSLLMGIYIIHPILIKIVRYVIPKDNNFINFLFAIFVYNICLGITYIMNKIPKVKELIRI